MNKFTRKVLRKVKQLTENTDYLSEICPEDLVLINAIRKDNLTYLSRKKLVSIVLTCRSLRINEINGIFVEAGCALGGSSILISKVKEVSRKMNVYDVFGMIPPPSKEDPKDVFMRYQEIVDGNSKGLGGDTYYGYKDDLLKIVVANLTSHGLDPDENNITFVKGLVQDTLMINEPIAFAHVDVDWYEPVKVCLERIFPFLAVGGSIILDDYHDWGGCRKATDEFLQTIHGEFLLNDSYGSMKLTKTLKSKKGNPSN